MKGVIVAAGYGTRFLPVTKTIPKEMLPLLNKPAIAFVVEELAASGITDIIFITSRRKKALEDYFDREIELENALAGDTDKGKLVEAYKEIRFSFVRQTDMLGTGHALLQAQPLLGEEPFVVAYPDDLHFGDRPLAGQLMDIYRQSGCSVMAAVENPPNLSRFGLLAPAADDFHVTDIIEKPPADQAPSRKATIGRYLYTPDFLAHLAEGWNKHQKGEYYHTYALKKLMRQNRVVYTTIAKEQWLDIGDQDGYLRAILRYAAGFPELAAEIKRFAQKNGISGPQKAL